jgi:hypothetical protein
LVLELILAQPPRILKVDGEKRRRRRRRRRRRELTTLKYSNSKILACEISGSKFSSLRFSWKG